MIYEMKAIVYEEMAHFKTDQIPCWLDHSVRPHLDQDCLDMHTSSPFPVLSLLKPKAFASVLRRIHGHCTFFFPTVTKNLSLLFSIVLLMVYSDQWLSRTFQDCENWSFSARIPATSQSPSPQCLFTMFWHVPRWQYFASFVTVSSVPWSLGGSVQTAEPSAW